MSKISTKTVARIAAVQALYQYQLNGDKQTADDLIRNLANYYKDTEMHDDLELSAKSSLKIKININYFSELVKYTIRDIVIIDDMIVSHLSEGWKWDNLHATLIALLRAAICELRYFPETPYRVVINEFTDIASDLLKENEVAFVNSLLDKVNQELKNLSEND